MMKRKKAKSSKTLVQVGCVLFVELLSQPSLEFERKYQRRRRSLFRPWRRKCARAQSCGGEGYRVEKPEELDKALKQAFKSDNPAIVDVVVDPDEMAPMIKVAVED